MHFRWIPNQQIDDFTCIPSEVQLYLKEMGDPAGSDPDAAPRKEVEEVDGENEITDGGGIACGTRRD